MKMSRGVRDHQDKLSSQTTQTAESWSLIVACVIIIYLNVIIVITIYYHCMFNTKYHVIIVRMKRAQAGNAYKLKRIASLGPIQYSTRIHERK